MQILGDNIYPNTIYRIISCDRIIITFHRNVIHMI